ncbi:MAG: hypothetical protein AB1758_02540, partial [Candidatus Eremiobacterota bacterium]
MKLTNLLVKLGLWSDPGEAPAAEPEKPPATAPNHEKRIVSMEGLKREKQEREEALTAAQLGLEATPEQIYRAAGISAPPHGWTLEKVGHELETGHAGDLVLRLAEHKVRVEDLLADGQRKDHSLDRYEEHLDVKVGGFLLSSTHKAEDLRRQARELLSEADRLEAGQQEVKGRLEAWRAVKRATEDELERVAGLLARLTGPAAGAAPADQPASAVSPAEPGSTSGPAGKTAEPAAAPGPVEAPPVPEAPSPVHGPPEAETAPWAPPA